MLTVDDSVAEMNDSMHIGLLTINIYLPLVCLALSTTPHKFRPAEFTPRRPG
jgi:hypothetical protein